MNARLDRGARPRTAPKAERRQQLIDAAMEVIAERGLSGTTSAEVTGRAGLSVGLLNHHFGSKDSLLKATLRYLAEEVRAHWVGIQSEGRLSAAQKLVAIIDGMFHADVCAPTKIAVWFAFFGDARYRAVYREMADEFDDERSLAIKALCRILKAEGGYSNVDPSALTLSIEALADGLWLSLMLYPDRVSAEQAKARLYEHVAARLPDHFTQVPPSPRQSCGT